ncbi:adult-specific rigid cuticular protein 15.7-like [Uloborus diversus]|uniref:adult-specific rigid cuticular protein 15.7-like n=1 Tax=Uloborus diversus TaxID=327109 RepID=UPI0024092371|nr:adult-specific rigid cuticular protein 15.7-like [Uloborus diversus]
MLAILNFLVTKQIRTSSPEITMQKFFVFATLIAAVAAQRIINEYRDQENNIPIPYSFSYSADTEDGGQNSRQETGDGDGRVTGSYTVQGEDGFGRVVDYIADENGFRATIRTNEPGTASQNPADVEMESTFNGQEPALRATPIARPVAPIAPIAPIAPTGRAGVRYVLVPITDPRAVGYY